MDIVSFSSKPWSPSSHFTRLLSSSSNILTSHCRHILKITMANNDHNNKNNDDNNPAFPSPPWPNPSPSTTAATTTTTDNSSSVTTTIDHLPDDNHNYLVTPPLLVSTTPTILHVSFNQDHGCFAAGTDQGFRIYNCDPFREIVRRDFESPTGGTIGGGIGVVEMLFGCNFYSLVGGGPEPQYPLNKVMIWDNHKSRCIGELSFRTEVRAVRLRRDRVVVVLEQKVLVYNMADLKLLHQIATIANPKGLCAVNQTGGAFVLVCLGLQKGQVRVELYASKRTNYIVAHDSKIACFALTLDGQVLATSSTKGTLIRIFNTADGTLLQEVRRGADRADIYSLAFSSTAQWLAVSSDKGTLHVFGLKVCPGSPESDTSNGASAPNHPITATNSSLSFIKGVLPKYFSSEWSVAKFRLREGCPYVVAFGHLKNTVVILGIDGSFYRCQFDPVNGGDMTQLEYHNFLKPEEAAL